MLQSSPPQAPIFRGKLNSLLTLKSQRAHGFHENAPECSISPHAPSPCVCPSQAGVVAKRLDESSWFWHGGFLLPIPHYKEIWVFPGIRVLFSGLRKFYHSKLITLSTKLVIVDGLACWRRLRFAVYYKSISCNPLTPLLWFVNCCRACFYSWQDFDWHSMSRDPSASCSRVYVREHCAFVSFSCSLAICSVHFSVFCSELLLNKYSK